MALWWPEETKTACYTAKTNGCPCRFIKKMNNGRWGNADIQALPFTPDFEISLASALGVQGAVFLEPWDHFHGLPSSRSLRLASELPGLPALLPFHVALA